MWLNCDTDKLDRGLVSLVDRRTSVQHIIWTLRLRDLCEYIAC